MIDDADALLAVYERDKAASGPLRAMRNLRRQLEPLPLQQWQMTAERLCTRGDFATAIALLEAALQKWPDALGLSLNLGETLRRAGEPARAEAVLRPLLASDRSGDAHAALAESLRDLGRLSAAAQAMAAAWALTEASSELRLTRLEFIAGCQRNALAAELAERALAQGARDPRLLAMAGRMAMTLGQFPRARERYLAAIDGGLNLNENFALQALAAAQRYSSREHPDIERFHRALRNTALGSLARASVLFALGKALDDVGDYVAAADALRRANALVRSELQWSRDAWDGQIRNTIAAAIPKAPHSESLGFTPVFIVGLPRSGTTLLAERLGRHPQLHNRGELNLLPYLEKWAQNHRPPLHPQLLAQMRAFAAVHLRQDDTPALCYVDKNPLNFRFLGLISAVLPEARILYCRRNARDTALSIWSQFFARREDNGYAYSFGDIAACANGCEQVMQHWRASLPLPVRDVRYEELVERPQETLSALCRFLGLPDYDVATATAHRGSHITTSSAWQARQPIYRHARGRWRAYAGLLPELTALFPDD